MNERVGDLCLLFPVGRGNVNDVQQQIGVLQLLQRGLERLDEIRRQLADEADGIGKQDLPLQLRQPETARRRIQRIEKAVVRRDVRAGQPVEHRGFSGVRIPDERGHRHGVFLAAAALRRADAAHLFEIGLQIPDDPADVPPVGLKLRFARAARADGRARAGLALKVGPHAGQPRQQIFILCKLHLQPALLCAGALGENIENESGPRRARRALPRSPAPARARARYRSRRDRTRCS